jgi:23S rRNA (adenine2503-C2)-methyltransferase
MDQNRLSAFLLERKSPSYRAAQAYQIFTRTLGDSWESVTAWPKELREEAAIAVPWDELKVECVLESKTGDAVKFLFACADGARIESVIMRFEHGRNTVCVSSQVGCPMKCAFCATGALGFKRNLTAEEMVDQVIHAARWLKEKDAKVTNVVYMGMGEPMHNYDEVMRSIRLLNDAHGFALGVRHISISTCGIVPGIQKFADEQIQVNLAISLHSAVPETRSKLMPVNAPYPIEKLMEAVDAYAVKTNRKVLFEYLLIDGVNDTRAEAEALASLLAKNRRLYQVNLIKYHDTHVFKATPQEGRERFAEWLRDRGIPVTLRRSFGEDILAACGQLAAKDQCPNGSNTTR